MDPNIIYKYIFVSDKPYLKSFIYRDVFQIVPHDFSLKGDSEFVYDHYLNVIEINLYKYYELTKKSVDISKIFFDFDKFEIESSSENNCTLSDAIPLFKKEHYVRLPKWILMKLLTVFSNHKHFDYSDEETEGWYKKKPFDGNDFEWGKKWLPEDENGIRIDSFTKVCGQIELKKSSEYYELFFNKEVNLPEDIHLKFDTFFHLEEEAQRCFVSSSVLFNQAISSLRFGSLSIVSLVSAIENLVNWEHRDQNTEKCEHCNQEKYKVTRKFNDFVDAHTEGFYSRREIKKMLGDIYSERSKIVHQGVLFPSEMHFPIWHLDTKQISQKIGYPVMIRYILNSWILKQQY